MLCDNAIGDQSPLPLLHVQQCGVRKYDTAANLFCSTMYVVGQRRCEEGCSFDRGQGPERGEVGILSALNGWPHGWPQRLPDQDRHLRYLSVLVQCWGILLNHIHQVLPLTDSVSNEDGEILDSGECLGRR